MPTYEYACTSCGHHIEVAQSFSDAPLETCPRCGGRLRRVFHPAGVLFKGSGFYSTDHRRAGGKPGSERKSSEKKAGSETSREPAKADKAPAAKASDD